jgi:predicted ferric reductase
MGIFVAAATLHSLLVPTLVRAIPLLAWWVYGIVTVGLGAYVYRETWFRVWARRHIYHVVRATHMGADVLEIDLDPLRAPILHRAGQFAFVSFADGPSRERHPFTISAAPSGGPLRFSVKASGDYTKALNEGLPEGSSASVEGPYGRFDFTTGHRRQLWVAGGIGITPFLAFLPTVDTERDVELVWSVHSRAEATYLPEVETDIRKHPNVRLTLWPSDERGHLNLANLGVERPGELSVYLCGPVAMRGAVLGQLDALGIPRERVHYEEFTLR